MKSNQLILFFFLSSLFITIVSCRNNNTAQNFSHDGPEAERSDTTVVKCINYPGFQFYIKKTPFSLLEDYHWFCTVHLNKTDKSIFLFETSKHFEDETPVNIYDNYFLWPGWTGGNGHYSTFKNVFKLSADTTFILGNVCNYDDITGDGKPELYNWYLIEYGKAHAFDKFENAVVTINADTLSRPFPANY